MKTQPRLWTTKTASTAMTTSSSCGQIRWRISSSRATKSNIRLRNAASIPTSNAVSVNDIALTGVENGTAYDYTTEEEAIGQRKVANFDNHVSENALRTLTISKKLFDYKGDPLYYPEAVPLKTDTTGSDGLFPTGNLPQGVYYLQETKAPIGYFNLSMALRIEISNGVITIEQNGVIRQSTAGDNDEHLLTVYNKSAFDIPATGVVGSQGIYMCGALLSLSVPLVWALSKCRQKKKKHSNS